MLAMGSGLDLPIINPNAESMMNAVMAFHVLSNKDRDRPRTSKNSRTTFLL